MKKRLSQNIVHRLRNRELMDIKPRTSKHYTNRCFYQNIFPNMSVINIDKPPCFLRKFTPDGKYLIAFSNDQSSLHVYTYQGPAVANELLEKINIEGDFVGGERSRMDESAFIQANIFSHFFKLKHIVNLTSNYERLNRECSLFTNDSRYVIVASSATINDQVFPSYYDVLRNNESMSVNIRFFLEDFCIYLIDMVKGKKCDQLIFKTDYIILSHNQGLYLHDDTLAVLSIQHQTIHIYHIVDSSTTGKKFLLINSIGRFCFEDDYFVISSPFEEVNSISPPSSSSFASPNSTASSSSSSSSSSLTARATSPDPAFHEVFISALKHRFLAFLYRRAHKESQTTGNVHPLVNYHRKFEHYLSLRMSKMQLLDKDHLLIKYEVNESITSRLLDNHNLSSYFVAYQISTATILQIYENNSNELLQIFENFCDYFRNTHSYVCSAGNNVYARTIAQRFKKLLTRDGGPTEATRRILSLLPISAQSYTPCPYLDLSLFSYDDRWVTPMERPKSCGEYPIRFYSRDDGSLRFKIHADHQHNDSPSALRLVAFSFHPYDPFALSIQRTNSDFVVNLHIRHVPQRL